MPVITNFYIVVGIVVGIMLILQLSDFTFMQRMMILLIIALVLLWFEKPDWFIDLLWKLRSIFNGAVSF